jgi:DNA end-binding protein Ku
VTPDKGGAKPYNLLVGGLQRSGRIGLGTVAIRNRETVAALGVVGSGLVLQLLRWADEVREAPKVEQVALSEQEEALADQLIAALSLDDDNVLDQFEDRYTVALTEVVEAKRCGIAPAKPEITAPKDIARPRRKSTAPDTSSRNSLAGRCISASPQSRKAG